MARIEIHVPCKETECRLVSEKNYNEEIQKLKDIGIEVLLVLHPNNKKGLPELYNEVLKNIRETKREIDYLFFMHSDVSFSIEEVAKRIVFLDGKYDLMGFAGAKKVDLGISPLTWFTSSKNNPEKRFGRITQNFHGTVFESYFNKDFPQTTDTEVTSVDGLCLILGKSLIYSDILFDKKFKQDFYDLDFSLQVILQKKMKIGCVVVPVFHESIGESVLTEHFLETEKIFREKWEIPKH